jgi:hypothetical protein
VEVYASGRQIHPLIKVAKDWEKGGLMLKKIDGTEPDMASNDCRVVAW